MTERFDVIDIECVKDGRWVASIAALPDCVCYGVTKEEAIRNVRELADKIRSSDMAKDGGDWKPGDPMPTEQAPEPTGHFSNEMHTKYLIGDDKIARPAHYARYAIEPCTFIMANDLPYAEGNVIKYICRWRYKNGRDDLLKAKRYIEMILEDLDRKEAGTVTDCVGKPL
jgi:predicted RNase H-like HicB family nuclease